MADREKVMKGLECCTADIPTDNNIHKDDFCKNCPYHKPEFWYCFAQVDLMRDALELLKDQEPKKVKCVRRLTKVMKGVCPACEMEIESVIHGRLTKFCKFCSQAVKWE